MHYASARARRRCAGATAALIILGSSPHTVLPSEQVFRGGVEVVTVTVSVTDPEGRLIGGLTKNAFKVLEDGVEQTVTAFSSERLPVSLGILLDVSDSMFGSRIADARAALERFLVDLLRPEDEVALLVFNHAPDVIETWTLDPRSLSGRLSDLRPFGGTALYDAVVASVSAFDSRRHQRAALLVISDGADTASDASLGETSMVLRSADPFVYAIAIESAAGRVPINTRVDPEALRSLTDPTGGYTEIVRDSSELPVATSRIADELNAQYTIGYTPDHPPDGKYHVIHVRIPNSTYVIRARRGYVSTRRRF